MKMTMSHRAGTVLLASFLTAAPMAAQAVQPSNQYDALIIGGKPSTNAAVVQLVFTSGGQQPGSQSMCSGSLISNEWVLTARHCTEGATNMEVRVLDSAGGGGTDPGTGPGVDPLPEPGTDPEPDVEPGGDNRPGVSWPSVPGLPEWGNWGAWGAAVSDWFTPARAVQADTARDDQVGTAQPLAAATETYPASEIIDSPNGDVGLVRLSRPVENALTISMTDSTVPSAGQDGTIYGYGARANSAPSDGQYQASVEVVGSASDAYSGPATKVKGVSGAANHGDSGGPLVVGGVVVGVCSTGDVDDPGADVQATANYANIENARAWIKQTAGI